MKLSSLGVALVLLTASVGASDLEDAFQSLKEAEVKKDPVQVKKWASEVYTSAEAIICTAMPQSEIEKEAWVRQVAYAKEVQVYSEYALYAAALQASPETAVDLMATLEQENPKSKYLNLGYGFYLSKLREIRADAQIPTIAERALQDFPNNEDVLLTLAENALTHNQKDRALSYSKRALAALAQDRKPDDMSTADWDQRRNTGLGHAYWIAGITQSEMGLYADANRNLRSALPLISGNQGMVGSALFYLGVANYQLGLLTLNKAQVLEGAKYSEQAAAVPGPHSEQAWKNAQLIKDAADKMR